MQTHQSSLLSSARQASTFSNKIHIKGGENIAITLRDFSHTISVISHFVIINDQNIKCKIALYNNSPMDRLRILKSYRKHTKNTHSSVCFNIQRTAAMQLGTIPLGLPFLLKKKKEASTIR